MLLFQEHNSAKQGTFDLLITFVKHVNYLLDYLVK